MSFVEFTWMFREICYRDSSIENSYRFLILKDLHLIHGKTN